MVALQKHLGFWGTKTEFDINGETYTATTKQGMLFNLTYSLADKEILIYKLGTSKSKIQISVDVKTTHIPEQHLLLIMALGFYSIKNVALEASANDFILSAVA